VYDCLTVCLTRRAQEQFDSRQAERQEMLQAITARQEEMQTLAQEKAQLQMVLDSCAAKLKVRSIYWI
jgi:DNA anti-recombination protein RmuC